MKINLKTVGAAAGVTLALLASQSAMADGGWRHRHGHGHGYYQGGHAWAPFALGAVIGGVAVGAMMQPQPVYVQPAYPPPPWYGRPRVVVQSPVVYTVPPPRVIYYDAD